jgi:oligosaccharide repeat unit polymerase
MNFNLTIYGRLIFPFFLFLISFFIFLSAIFFLDENGIILTLINACLIFILLFITSLDSRLTLLSPIHFLLYFTFLQIVLRSTYIIYNIPDPQIINEVFLQGSRSEILIFPALLFLISYLFFSIGYLGIKKSKFVDLQTNSFPIYYGRQFSFLLLVSLVSFFAFVYFINETAGNFFLLTIENLSKHRGLSDSITEYQSYGFVRFLIQLSQIPYYLLFQYFIAKGQINFKGRLILIFSFFVYFLYSFYSQSRASAIFLIFNSICLLILSKKKINYKLYLLLPIILLFNNVMTKLREGSFEAVSNFEIFDFSKFLDPILISTSGLDYSKTFYMIRYISTNDVFQYGKTFLFNFVWWIPRDIWPNKPFTLDTYFGENVYGAQTYGAGAVPPGFIVELYFNFGLLGVVVGSLILGIIIKVLFNYFYSRLNIFEFKILYVLLFLNILISIYGSSFNSTFMATIQLLFPFILIINILTFLKKSL